MNKYQRKYKDKTKATHSYNKGNRTLQSKRYRKKYDKKVKATAKVNRCILKGLLVKPEKCSLCKKREVYMDIIEIIIIPILLYGFAHIVIIKFIK